MKHLKKFKEKEVEEVKFSAKSLESDKEDKPTLVTSTEDQEKVEKEFKKELDKPIDDGIRRPQTIEEYKLMLLDDLLKKRHIQQIKSRQIKIPTSNIGMSDRPSDLNRLFKYSQK